MNKQWINLSIYEMFENVSKATKEADKVSLLQQYSNESQGFGILVDLVFNPAWKWLLPPGAPPYNASPKEHDNQNVLKSEARKLQYFVNTPQGNNMKPLRRETMFIELLESVHFHDAKLLLAAKDKSLPFKGVTKKHIKKAFPDMAGSW